MKYRTIAGDMLDAICYKHYLRHGLELQVLEANPGLAEREPVLPAGVVIELPELPTVAAQTTVRLWD